MNMKNEEKEVCQGVRDSYKCSLSQLLWLIHTITVFTGFIQNAPEFLFIHFNLFNQT